MINKFQNFRLLNYAASLFLLCLLCLVVLTAQTQAQVTVDSRSTGGAFSNTGLTTLSWTHTVGSGSNRALVVGIAITNQVATAPVCSPSPCPPNTLPTMPTGRAGTLFVTNNGVPMLALASALRPNIVQEAIIFVQVNPPLGTNNIVATFSPAGVTHAVGNSVSFFGVNQTGTSFIVENSASISPSNTASLTYPSFGNTNYMVFDILSSTPDAGSFIEGPGQTVCADPTNETTCTRGRRFFLNAYDVGASSTKRLNPAGTTMSWTMATAQPWIMLAVAVVPVTPPLVSVVGRVLTSTGRAVSKARVTLTYQNGEIQTAVTNSFGYYRLDNVQVGQTATLTVFSKQFQFIPRTFTVSDNPTQQFILTSEP